MLSVRCVVRAQPKRSYIFALPDVHLHVSSPVFVTLIYLARNAAQIIKSLISSDRIVAEESSSLSKIYSECSSEDSKSQDRQGDDRGAMLLTKEAVDKIVTSQGLGSVGKEELLRALGQVCGSPCIPLLM